MPPLFRSNNYGEKNEPLVLAIMYPHYVVWRLRVVWVHIYINRKLKRVNIRKEGYIIMSQNNYERLYINIQ